MLRLFCHTDHGTIYLLSMAFQVTKWFWKLDLLHNFKKSAQHQHQQNKMRNHNHGSGEVLPVWSNPAYTCLQFNLLRTFLPELLFGMQVFFSTLTAICICYLSGLNYFTWPSIVVAIRSILYSSCISLAAFMKTSARFSYGCRSQSLCAATDVSMAFCINVCNQRGQIFDKKVLNLYLLSQFHVSYKHTKKTLFWFLCSIWWWAPDF